MDKNVLCLLNFRGNSDAHKISDGNKKASLAADVDSLGVRYLVMSNESNADNFQSTDFSSIAKSEETTFNEAYLVT